MNECTRQGWKNQGRDEGGIERRLEKGRELRNKGRNKARREEKKKLQEREASKKQKGRTGMREGGNTGVREARSKLRVKLRREQVREHENKPTVLKLFKFSKSCYPSASKPQDFTQVGYPWKYHS